MSSLQNEEQEAGQTATMTLILLIGVFFYRAVVMMYLWNWFMPEINVPTITYGISLGLSLLLSSTKIGSSQTIVGRFVKESKGDKWYADNSFIVVVSSLIALTIVFFMGFIIQLFI